jgi:hypothetical protein
MKKWVVFVLLAAFLNIPAVSGAGEDQVDNPGSAKFFNYWFLKVPFGAKPDSKAGDEKKAHAQAKSDEPNQGAALNKKVDDAIEKAWEQK